MEALRIFAQSEDIGSRTMAATAALVAPAPPAVAAPAGANVGANAAAPAPEPAAPAPAPAPPTSAMSELSLERVAPTTAPPAINAVAAPGAKKLRVMICGTHPYNSNGYSHVVTQLAKYLGAYDDIALTVYGFQLINKNANALVRHDIPSSVVLHDAMATENPRRQGFGEKEIGGYLKEHPQDVIIIFNDMIVVSSILATLVNEFPGEERKKFRIVIYSDWVYPYQRKQFIDNMNNVVDGMIFFTPYWRDVAMKTGIRADMPTFVLPHGHDPMVHYPIPRRIARMYHALPQDAFLILILNRNQPRKRLDHAMMALALVAQKHQELIKKNAARPEKDRKTIRPIKMVIGTAMEGSWDLVEVLQFELRLLGLDPELAKEYLVAMPRPQMMSDRDINVLYSACDIGLNCAMGEGWGLCQSQHLGVGCPQVVVNTGGHREFLSPSWSMLVEPRWNFYLERHVDGVGGRTEVGTPGDFAESVWKYFTNPALVEKHGKAGRKNMLQNYRWKQIVDYFHDMVVQDLAALPIRA